MTEPSTSDSFPSILATPSRRWLAFGAVVLLLLLPFLYAWGFRFWNNPGVITIATGPVNGRYREIGRELETSLERSWGYEIRLIETQGSVENLKLLRSGAADFAIVQGDVAFASSAGPDPDDVAFVGNMYSEVVHVVVRRDHGISTPDDLRTLTVSIGREDSGDRYSADTLLEHFGLKRTDIDAREYDYAEVRKHFRDETLDVAFITSSPRAPILRDLLSDGNCDVIDVPFAAALSRRELVIEPYVIPAGLYRSRPPQEPPHDVQTVAVRSQLLCRADVPDVVVTRVTRELVGKEFVKRNELEELYREGVAFAVEKPTFDLHTGAERVYDPALRPLIDPEFAEATENIRSFAVSLLIGLFLLYRWVRRVQIRREEHRLDRYIHALLAIERKQNELDHAPGDDDLSRLRDLQNELTRLRQSALEDFSAHELREDRATDCFLEMCHALSDKIDAKITRQRIERGLAALESGPPATGNSGRPGEPVSQA